MPIQMTLLSELLPLAGRAVPTCLETGRKILYSMCICINAATTAIPEGVGHANCKTPMEERTKQYLRVCGDMFFAADHELRRESF